MKFKLLIGGDNPALLRDFFTSPHDNFSCLTTSEYWEDISKHYLLYEPHALVWMLERKEQKIFSLFTRLRSNRTFSFVPIVVITNDSVNFYLENSPNDSIDLVLLRPITISSIFQKIGSFLEEYELSRQRKLTRDKLLMQRALQDNTASDYPVITPVRDNRKHILIIDDDRNILKLLKSTLENKYKVTTMITGKTADRFLMTQTCDLILLDYEMPDENGPEVYQRIRKLPGAETIPVVFLTGVADSDRIAQVLMLKPQGYLLKPINAIRLMSTINQLLQS